MTVTKEILIKTLSDKSKVSDAILVSLEGAADVLRKSIVDTITTRGKDTLSRDTVSDAVNGAFAWSDQPQGSSFWHDLYQKTKGVSPAEPEVVEVTMEEVCAKFGKNVKIKKGE